MGKPDILSFYFPIKTQYIYSLPFVSYGGDVCA
jgi:hypothetical protein